MATLSSDADDRPLSDDSEFNFLPGYVPTNLYCVEVETNFTDNEDDEDEALLFDGVEPYADEPLADENWTMDYEMRQAEKEKRLESLNDRLAGTEPVGN
ncbi:hypothetical protein QZH41_019549 [Actinostola sp. cb2023]|nr:hypothetical protein QZH41_019549 [Actinostola sp. cb2023]